MVLKRNDLCSCGSGKKYKVCCISKKEVLTVEKMYQTACQMSQSGDYFQAEKLLLKCAEQDQNCAEIYHLLGIICAEQGRVEEAIHWFYQVIQLSQDNFQAHFYLGQLLNMQGNVVEAIKHYMEAVRLNPKSAKTYNNLGTIYFNREMYTEAKTCYDLALLYDPEYSMVLYNMGNVLQKIKDYSGAYAYYEKALFHSPNNPQIYLNLGVMKLDEKKYAQAEKYFFKALEINPGLAEVYNNLGIIYDEQGKDTEAIRFYKKALKINPNYDRAFNNMGNAYRNQGLAEKATDCYRNSLESNPEYTIAHSNLLLSMHYSPNIDPDALLEEHRNFDSRHGSALARPNYYSNELSLVRPLKIGYVSPDFRKHSVSYFIEPVLANHDKRRFEIYCYSDVVVQDDVTLRFKGYASEWRDIAGMTDSDIAELIQCDKIDILIDLAGHTAKNRMLLFARKPAPIQITWIGYPGTTGLSTMDYRITDAYADPAGDGEHYYTERLLRMPKSFLVYSPPKEYPVIDIDAVTNRAVTFGSFNHLAKITIEMIELWSKILKQVPESRLVLKNNGLDQEEIQQRIRSEFFQFGIDKERIELIGWKSSSSDHLATYNQIDIALDTFPYHGTTTTCEALLMGVPVITLLGKYHVSRVGASLLSNIGLTQFITHSQFDYVERAVSLALQPELLNNLRSTIRGRFLQSSLTDAVPFTKDLEKLYAQVWDKYCIEQKCNDFSNSIKEPSVSRNDMQNVDSGMSNRKHAHITLDSKANYYAAVQYYEKAEFDRSLNICEKLIAEGSATAEVYNLAGVINLLMNSEYKAQNYFEHALELRPDYPEVYCNIGVLCLNQDLYEQAIAHFGRAITLEPQYADAYNNLGNALKNQGNLTDAELCYKEAIKLKPNFAKALHNLGHLYHLLGNQREALSQYMLAIRANPEFADIYNNVGFLLHEMGMIKESEKYYKIAIQKRPNYAEAYNNLGNLYYSDAKPHEAEECYNKAISITPDYLDAFNNTASLANMQGNPKKAIQYYREVLKLKPSFSQCHSNLLLTLNYIDDCSPIEKYEEHLKFAMTHAQGLSNPNYVFPNKVEPNRPLRIGFVSADFRDHSVAYFLEPVLDYYDRTQFTVFCYSDVLVPDLVTQRLKEKANVWRCIRNLSDQEAARLILDDNIDVLIDIAGHTANNRMLLFSRKPAPVQVSWLGYPNTTGLKTMDYRIVDALTDPVGSTEHLHSEKLVRLPNCFLSYKAPDRAPEVSDLPAIRNRHVTLGSFNNLAKVTEEVLQLWAEILVGIRDSHLVIKSDGFNDPDVCERVWKYFENRQISKNRVELIGRIRANEEHLAAYHSIDIALDTFPYNGTTTTCEALWMGIPVVTLSGESHVSRVGVSLLTNVELPELIASNKEEYKQKVVDLANDSDFLLNLRLNLRNRMRHSFLMNSLGFTRKFEYVLREVWTEWCNQRMLSE
ncbi:Photosystem I assembly protein Ycf3 [Paenibacillus solanacearum]|uniref:Photosystem I assembly protein Ycf3 n=1 Tax=Paenibacillus solanacearum TaxID=2048548 RepID=A0A916NQD1_9BACL|nr:tetratricopeptide repeat protein [Paenibacillus solanacearum]CAG7633937.1 Photosystem I assembly protein Ycf3 [Paenibacillus solanacearum]